MLARLLPTNEGTADRVLRVLVGAAILSLAFIGPKTPWAWFGLVPILTGLVGSCPLYTVLGIGTCPVHRTP
jgi:predicted small integral membrane protein